MENKAFMAKIEEGFKERVCDGVQIKSEGKDRYRIFTPFMFSDGDHFQIILKKEDRGWVLSDEGHTLMRLSFNKEGINFIGKNRNTIANKLSRLGIQEIHGELTALIHNEGYGDTLTGFIQAIKVLIKGGKNEKRNRPL